MQFLQRNHIVPAINPIDINGAGADGDIVGMQLHNHLCILVAIGNIEGDVTLTVEECDDVTPSNSTAIAFNYREMSTSDVWGALTAAESSGLTIANASDDNQLFAIELDADELTDGYPYVRVRLSDPSAACVVAAQYILSEPRYAQDVPITQIT